MDSGKEMMRLEWVVSTALPHQAPRSHAGAQALASRCRWDLTRVPITSSGPMGKVRHPSLRDALPRCCKNLSEPETRGGRKATNVY